MEQKLSKYTMEELDQFFEGCYQRQTTQENRGKFNLKAGLEAVEKHGLDFSDWQIWRTKERRIDEEKFPRPEIHWLCGGAFGSEKMKEITELIEAKVKSGTTHYSIHCIRPPRREKLQFNLCKYRV